MADSAAPARARQELIFAGIALLVAAGLVAVLVLFMGARLDAATAGLAATCGALLYSLRGLFSVVQALSRPHADLVLQGEAASGRARAELRDEKRRVLRAIKELDFDYGMGKLSKADFDEIRGAYQVRAVEVMRELEGVADGLHPGVEALLSRGAADEGPAPSASTGGNATAAPSTLGIACRACEGTNDLDAKFCKHCGGSLGDAP